MYNYFYMIETIRAACSIIPAAKLTFLSLHVYLYPMVSEFYTVFFLVIEITHSSFAANAVDF